MEKKGMVIKMDEKDLINAEVGNVENCCGVSATNHKVLIEELDKLMGQPNPYLSISLPCKNEIVFEKKEDIKSQNYKCDCGCKNYFIKLEENLK